MPRIALLIPCYNEEEAIGKVVEDFKALDSEMAIYVYDNNSSDSTAEVAARAGALVCKEYRQGKGFVIRSMFRDVDADVYLMVDGDDTYNAAETYALAQDSLAVLIWWWATDCRPPISLKTKDLSITRVIAWCAD